jgi:hypothetical protein
VAESELEPKEARDYWLKPENLEREVKASQEQRNGLMEEFADMVKAYEGPARHGEESDFAPENHYFEWISLVLPQVVFQNPQATVSSKRPEIQHPYAIAIEAALNRWIADTRYHRYLERIGVYWAFFVGVGMTTVEEEGDFEDPRHRPRTLVMDPAQFVLDSLARWPEEARFMGHECIADRADLKRRAKEEDGWYLKAVEALAMASDDGMLGRPKADVRRDDVTYCEVWVPELDTREDGDSEDEYHGTILTFGALQSQGGGRKAGFLRKPRPFYGPRWGPYTIFGAYTVPRSAWFMGPLQAHEGQVRELNINARANSTSAARRKTIMLYDEADKKTAEAVLKAPDGSGVGIPGFEKARFDIFQSPGVTEAALQYEQWLRGRLVRVSGISDPVLSQSATGATATADAIASQALSARMAYLEQKIYEATRQQLLTIAWYYWHDDRIVEPLGEEATAMLAQQGLEVPPGARAAWKGGENPGKFDDLELEVVPYSMRRMDEAAMQGRALQMFQVLTSVAPLIPQTPWMPWRELLDKLGNAMNWPDIGSGINLDLANAVAAMMLQNQIEVPPGGQTGQRQIPRMAGDVGAGMSNGAPPRLQRPSEMAKGPSLPGNRAGAIAGGAAKKSVA